MMFKTNHKITIRYRGKRSTQLGGERHNQELIRPFFHQEAGF